MSKKSFEDKTADTQGIKEGTGPKNGYRRYLKLGGIINEKDYQSALDRMSNARAPNRKNPQVKNPILQVLEIARHAEIRLNNSAENTLDPRIVLYMILRNDTRPKDVRYHHSQMSDQRIFGEVLRMLEDADSLDKLIKAYPNISFKYERGE